jgi:hypothetical protein
MLTKFIEKPFLINKKKFSIRLIGLLTEKDQLYSFRESLAVFQKEDYLITDIKKSCEKQKNINIVSIE